MNTICLGSAGCGGDIQNGFNKSISNTVPLIEQPSGLHASALRVSVASLLAQGRTVREIALRIHRTEHTVRYHLKQAFAKTGVRRQAELVRLMLAVGAA